MPIGIVVDDNRPQNVKGLANPSRPEDFINISVLTHLEPTDGQTRSGWASRVGDDRVGWDLASSSKEGRVPLYIRGEGEKGNGSQGQKLLKTEGFHDIIAF